MPINKRNVQLLIDAGHWKGTTASMSQEEYDLLWGAHKDEFPTQGIGQLPIPNIFPEFSGVGKIAGKAVDVFKALKPAYGQKSVVAETLKGLGSEFVKGRFGTTFKETTQEAVPQAIQPAEGVGPYADPSLYFPEASAKAVDLVSALSPTKQAAGTALPKPPADIAQLPAIAPTVTPENILEKAKAGKFSQFVSNPNFIRFLAEMGSSIGGEGSVGERLGQATIQLQRSQIYDQALTKALAGEPFDDLPVHLLSMEERASLDQQRLVKLKTEADIAELESKREERDITESEKIRLRGEETRKSLRTQAAYTPRTKVQTGAEVSDDVVKDTQTKLRARQGLTFGTVLDTGEQKRTLQETFLENISRYPAGEVKTEAPRFFDPYTKDTQTDELFFSIGVKDYPDGIYKYTDKGGVIIVRF